MIRKIFALFMLTLSPIVWFLSLCLDSKIKFSEVIGVWEKEYWN